ncbi:virulence RhuM family protein [Pelagibius litoralis]|uniref:Virulence RhuM family protein n=1 Tax=Pelagibius litoralis TaxID=374515 RepID=A0A967F3L1_9PROT|nr:RhuM family protein [Pelagibius litoralis]NIA72367.1 virulence RhuM family protein [Pelagibius litoralis]
MAPKKRSSKHDPRQGVFELVHYDGSEEAGEVDLGLDPVRDTMWASIEQMSQLFGRKPNTITEHVRNIFREGELDEASVARKFRVTAKDGKSYSILHYNLDVIISVGYRVSSREATKFRQWATGVLKAYITEGYALNESRLIDDPTSLKKLASDVRRLRTDEKNIYQSVRDTFKLAASDYNSRSTKTRSFYAKLQDKFTYAITGSTSAEIVVNRADGMKDFMGLTSTRSGRPTKQDAKVGKNYLNPDELYGLHILCEQFLLYVESRAIAGQELTMEELNRKFDELLKVQGYPVFKEYKSYLVKKAKVHAEREFEVYRQRMHIRDQRRPKSLTT